MHECIVGMLHEYENTELVTIAELKKHIEKENRLPNYFNKKPYQLSDYCDKRKSTDLTRFEYCPICGKNIGWKVIKETQ